jgi:hypothetical protein
MQKGNLVNPMRWGFAGPWYGQLMTHDKDPLQARLKFLRHHGLNVVGMGLRQIENMTGAQRDSLAQFLSENGMEVTPHVGFDYLQADADEAKRQAEAVATSLSTHLSWMKSTIAVTTPTRRSSLRPRAASAGKVGSVCRRSLALLAEGPATNLACRFGIENTAFTTAPTW